MTTRIEQTSTGYTYPCCGGFYAHAENCLHRPPPKRIPATITPEQIAEWTRICNDRLAPSYFHKRDVALLLAERAGGRDREAAD